jgi:lipopolysaccharide transport system permease protein
MMRPRSDVQALDSVPSVTVRSGGAPLGVDLHALWEHRELLFFLVWRDIKVRYRQTVLGIMWAVLQPLAIAMSISMLFGRLVHVPQGELPYPVFAYAGMVLWQLFSQGMLECSNSLLANQQLVTKVYFPRLFLPLSTVLASLLDFAISLLVLAGFLGWFRIAPQVGLLLIPVFVIMTAATALGIGLWLAALNVKYRDVRYTLAFLIQFWFFATPIAYPSSAVPERWQALYALNPMVGIVEGFRWALRGAGALPGQSLAISAGVIAVIFVGGLYYFQRTEDTFADYI